MRILTFFLCFAVCFLFCSSGERAAKPLGDTACVASLGCTEEGDELEIELGVGCRGGLCGFFGELVYDSETFLLLSCGTDVEGGNFSWCDGSGAVRFLFDGAGNCGGDGLTVRFYFKRIDGALGGTVFSLNPDMEVFYLSEAGSLERPHFEIDVGEIEIRDIDGEFGRGEAKPPELVDIEIIRGEGEKAEVVLVGETSEDYFALGFKVFAIELDSGRSLTLYVSRIVGGEKRTELRAELSMIGGVSLVVTPLAFWREGVVEGDSEVFVFASSGEITI